MLLHFLGKLISQRRGGRLALHGNVARGLIVDRDPHLGIGQALKQMQQDLDRVIMRIDRRRKGLPIRLRALDELNLGRVAPDRFLEVTDLESNDPDVEREEQKSRGVSCRPPRGADGAIPFA